MAYFPMFINIDGLKILLIGGGTIATEKLEKLLDFSTDITILALEVKKSAQHLVDTHELTVNTKAYEVGDIKGYDVVIIATDTPSLHQQVYEESRGSGIWVNSVDNIKYCDFIFPSYVKKEDLTIAFSTGGASPAFAKKIRQYCEIILPENVGTFLKKMKSLRHTMPKGKKRMAYFEQEVEEYFRKYFK